MNNNLQTFCKLLLLAVLTAGSGNLWGQSLVSVAYTDKDSVLLSYAHDNRRQEPGESVRLESVLKELETGYKVNFAYDGHLVKDKYVAVKEFNQLQNKSESIEVILNRILKPLSLKYAKINEVYVLYYANPKESVVPMTPQQLHMDMPDRYESGGNSRVGKLEQRHTQLMMMQEKNISGQVTDENSEPLPGVNILVKNTTIGTVTDVNGNYVLNVPDDATILIFSSVGYLSEEIEIGGRSTLNVEMVPDIKALSEVVVVAYGTQEKADLTSSVVSLKAKDLGQIAVASADALLQGKAAGVQVVQNSGQPGGEVYVRIRGSNSLLGESRPLYVIDGVPMTNIDAQPLGGGGQRYSGLADINPNDIESIEILKDAAAAALYGSRGSNGVVLITTKRGRSGEARFSFDAYYGMQDVIKRMDMMNGQEYVDITNEGLVNRGLATFPELVYTGIETDWQDEVLRTAPMANYNLSVTGGTEKLSSYVSLGYFKQSGTLIGQEYDRINGRLNLDYQAKKFIKIGTNTTFTSSTTDHVDADFSEYSVLSNALFFNPNVPVRNPDGTYGRDPINGGVLENPVMIANELHHEIRSRRLISNLYAEVQFLNHFKFRTTFGIDYLNRREERFIPSFFQKARGVASSSAAFYEEMIWQNENTLLYENSAGKHSYGAIIGYSALESTASSFSINGNTTATDIITTFSAANIFPPNHNIGSWGLQSLFTRINYAFDDKYLFEASIRRDGSSRFGENNRFGYFPAVSAGWRLSSEPFMSGITEVVSDLKLRASYGVTGNQDGIANFGSLTLYSGGVRYDGLPAIYKSSVGNPDLKWETTVSTNVGLDMSLFNGRFDLSADAYIRQTEDLFYPLQLPQTTGFSQITRVNLGDMENRGIELSFTSRNLVGNFKWTTNFNIAFNRNEIKQLSGLGLSELRLRPISLEGFEGPVIRLTEGKAIGQLYGYQYLGIWGSPEYPEVTPGLETNRFGLGDPVYLDVNNDLRFNRDDDQVLIGNALPLHIGGMTNTFEYMGFDLNIVMNWSYGNDIYNQTRQILVSTSRERNQLIDMRDRWTPENTTASLPRAKYRAPSPKTDGNSLFIEDGSFLRIRNITLGYTLPRNIVDRIKLTNARIYASGQNLFTFTNYTGFDPESQNLNVTQAGVTPSLGIDFLTQPISKVYMLGVNVTF